MICLTVTRPRILPLPLNQPNIRTRTLRRSSSCIRMSQTIEHIVLFKVKDDTNPTKITSMVNGLNSLVSLDGVLHLSCGPVHRNRSSSSFTFTHMLHSRYKTKEDLDAYIKHPAHMGLVKDEIKPICDDIMMVDWAAEIDEPIVHPTPGTAMRLSLMKLKEGSGESEKKEALEVAGSVARCSIGENFSPMAKGFPIASLAVFPGVKELEAVDLNENMVKHLVESLIVVDYIV